MLRLNHPLLAAIFFVTLAILNADCLRADDEAYLFTPQGFNRPGQAILKPPAASGHLKLTIRDASTNEPTFCRVNVVGSDGNYYYPKQNYLSRFALTGQWTGKPTNPSLGNRVGKAPIRYLGRFFYSWGQNEIDVPAGPIRVEVWKGLEYRPETARVSIAKDETREVALTLKGDAGIAKAGYYSGDSHVHLRRQDDADEQTIFDLLQAEDIHFASILAYNEPAGPYQGIMQTLASPQFRGVGPGSLRDRGEYHFLSGQEYRSATYGHLNLYFRNDLVLANKQVNANNGPLYGAVARETHNKGGFAFYCHGGYAQTDQYAEIYADAIQGNVDGVELLQFGIYRELGLEDWYRFLNIGYQFPCLGASDYPACRWLGDCRTYAKVGGTQNMKTWFEAAAAGRSFVTTGPLLDLEVDGHSPGDRIELKGDGPHTVTAHLRVHAKLHR